jgi:hypothetical protein
MAKASFYVKLGLGVITQITFRSYEPLNVLNRQKGLEILVGNDIFNDPLKTDWV